MTDPCRKAGSHYTFGLLQDQISTWGLCAAGGCNEPTACLSVWFKGKWAAWFSFKN